MSSSESKAPQKSVETRDISVKGVTISGLVIIISVPLVMGIAALLLYFDWSVTPEDESLFSAEPKATVPGPKLQSNPEQDWNEYRRVAEQTLHNWSRSSSDPSQVRMPIELAMQRVVEEHSQERNAASNPEQAPVK